ncbi:MAG TPA: alkylphosphonate utilization protein [Candidatus Didemnitutus sp.]|nr:alkylphosphonate utilization protein [Candidatus Didemnitutus sp.]
MEIKDSLGNVLATGDTIKVIKDLKVGGTSVTLKGGQVIKKIRVTDDPDHVDCKVDGIKIAVKTEFVRKVS